MTAFSLKSLVSHSCSFWPLVPCEKSGISRPARVSGSTIMSMVKFFPLKLRLASLSTLALPVNCMLTFSDMWLLLVSPFTSKFVVDLR